MIREILDSLPPEERKALMFAFNELLCYIYDLPDRHFVGVHIDDATNLEIIETNGCWFYGKYK